VRLPATGDAKSLGGDVSGSLEPTVAGKTCQDRFVARISGGSALEPGGPSFYVRVVGRELAGAEIVQNS